MRASGRMPPSASYRRFHALIIALIWALAWAIASPGTSAWADNFDYADYNGLLGKYVNHAGEIDYRGLLKERHIIDAMIARMGEIAPGQLSIWPRREQLAFWINAYNAITIQRVLDHYPPERRIPLIGAKYSIDYIRGVRAKLSTPLAGKEVTLDQIEQQIWSDPIADARIHCALVRGAKSCPSLAHEAYTGEKLDDQLTDAARDFARDPEKNFVDPIAGKVVISAIFKQHREDFEVYADQFPGLRDGRRAKRNISGGLGFLALYGNPETRALLTRGKYSAKFNRFNRALNDQDY